MKQTNKRTKQKTNTNTQTRMYFSISCRFFVLCFFFNQRLWSRNRKKMVAEEVPVNLIWLTTISIPYLSTIICSSSFVSFFSFEWKIVHFLRNLFNYVLGRKDSFFFRSLTVEEKRNFFLYFIRNVVFFLDWNIKCVENYCISCEHVKVFDDKARIAAAWFFVSATSFWMRKKLPAKTEEKTEKKKHCLSLTSNARSNDKQWSCEAGRNKSLKTTKTDPYTRKHNNLINIILILRISFNAEQKQMNKTDAGGKNSLSK